MKEPQMFPLPPESAVPPRMTEVMASSSNPSPMIALPVASRDDWSTPAQAAVSPVTTKTAMRVRSTLMPLARAAASLEPIARVLTPKRVWR